MNPRLQKFRKLLIEENLDAVLISSVPNITYLTNFSGFFTEDRDAYLLITKNNQYIFTHGIYKESVKNSVKSFSLIDIKRENPIGTAVKTIIKEEKIKRLGFEAFDLKVTEYERLIKEIDENILTATDLVHKLRIYKTLNEIMAIKKACQLGDKAFGFILSKLKTGITEINVAVELEFFIKKQGANISFPSIVAFGANASKPHHVATNNKLKPNSLVLLDFGIKLNNYCSDMTRTVFFGKATPEQKKVYKVVFESQKKAIETLKSLILNPKSSIKAQEIDKSARDYIVIQGFASIPHSLGHGIGLEVHESPRLTPVSDEILKPGMVFSIEPGIYLPSEFGIRIEDLFAIENNQLIQLTNAPKNIIELSTSS